MHRYYKLIQVSTYVLYFIAIVSAISMIFGFGSLLSSNRSQTEDVIRFLSNWVVVLSIIFSILFGKKYLYNFQYFSINRPIDEEDNLINKLPLPNANYEDVPEPYKIIIPIATMLAVSCLNAFVYIFYMVMPFIGWSSSLYGLIQESFLLKRNIPALYMGVLPMLAMLFYSLNMFVQWKYYKKYYAALVSEDAGAPDLIHELHENK